MKLEVGKSYKDIEGDIIRIIGEIEDCKYKFIGESQWWKEAAFYDEDGKHDDKYTLWGGKFNLVQEVNQ